MTTELPIWVWGCDALGITAAILLLYLGRRRRIGEDLRCRRCGYLLRGLQSKRCPECGSDLIAGTVAHGEVTRNRWAFATALLLVAFIALITVAARPTPPAMPVRAPALVNPDPYANKSNRFLLNVLSSGKPASVESVWNELTKRDLKGLLSAGERGSLVAFALASQGQPNAYSSYLNQETVNYLGHRAYVGDLQEPQKQQFFQRVAKAELHVSNQVLSTVVTPYSDQVYYGAYIPGPGPFHDEYLLRLNTPSVYIDGKQQSLPFEPDFGSTGLDHVRLSSGCRYPDQLVGKHQLDVTLRVRIYKGTKLDSPTLYDAEQNLSSHFELLKEIPKEAVTPIFDSHLAAAVKAAIHPPHISIAENDCNLKGYIRVSNPPVDLAYNVYVRYGDYESEIARFVWESGDGECDYSLSCHVNRRVTDKLDIILRPAPLAVSDSSMHKYWNEDITFEGIPTNGQ